MNSAKRRRLNDNNAATLFKPFRSPLKAISKQPEQQGVHRRGQLEEKESIPDEVTSSVPGAESTSLPTSLSTRTPRASDQDAVQLQKDYAALCQQLRCRRQTLDILKQSLAIRTSNQQEKLAKLTVKWRDTARDLADEVFESTSTQVKDMGGLQAMQKQELASGWSDAQHSSDCYTRNFDSDHDHAICESDRRTAIKEPEEFNMALMLRQLNIDPDLLGFDSERDDWCNQVDL